MTLSTASQWVGLIALLLSIGNLLWAWISRPARDLGKRIEETESELGGRIDAAQESLKAHDRRIQRVEDDYRHLPTKEDLHDVVTQLTSVKVELSAVARTANRIDEYLRSPKP